MTHPHWTTTAEDYLRWMDRIIDRSGGVLQEPHVVAEPFDVAEQLGEGYEHRLVIDRHHLKFPGVGLLEFRLILVERLTLDQEPLDVYQSDYSYHFHTQQRPLIWRYDLHDGHTTRSHVHQRNRWGRETVEPCHEVDLEDVIQIIHRDHMT